MFRLIILSILKRTTRFFFKYHPKQDISDPVLQRAIYRKDGTKRKWLTYSEEQGALTYAIINFNLVNWMS
jgi:hypothetical protein